MNDYARRLGMTNTHFDDSSGLPSPTHYTTARDLSLLASALVRDFPEYYPWFSLREFVWNNIKQENRNGLLERDPSVDGMKTGHTDSAGYCLVTSARRQDMRLIAVVLGSHSIKGREDASAALVNYGFTFYRDRQRQAARNRGTQAARLQGRRGIFIGVGPATDINIVVPRGQAGSIKTTATVQRPIDRAAEHQHPGRRNAGRRQRQAGHLGTALPDRRRTRGRDLEPAQRYRAALVPEVTAHVAEPLPICYLNGGLMPLREARISPLDRSFLFGDGVYEVIPARARPGAAAGGESGASVA